MSRVLFSSRQWQFLQTSSIAWRVCNSSVDSICANQAYSFFFSGSFVGSSPVEDSFFSSFVES